MMEDRIRELEKQVKNHEERMMKIEGNRELQAFQYKTITDILQELKSDVKELKSQPTKRYDLGITAFITALITGLITIAINKLF